jgi:DNA-binding winged helix-turn-helix (wHTH) protein/Tol biopolymer transport system component
MAFATEDPRRSIRFGRYTFEFDTNRLYKSGRETPIQDQPATLLAILLERPGELVTREEIQTRLWPDQQFLEFDAALNTTVKKLRQVLQDDAAAPQFIQTVPKKGYRFIGQLSAELKPEIAPEPRRMKVVPISPEASAAAAEMQREPEENDQIASPKLPETPKGISPWARHSPAITIAAIAIILIAVALLVFLRTRSLPDLVERPLTSNSNEDILVDSALSPDGKYLAYANPRHVLILNVADRVTHTLPNLDRLSVFHLTWTHDSTRLLVVGYEHPGATSSLWQVSILGNDEPQKVSENVYDSRESPDGKSLALVRADLGELSIVSSVTLGRIQSCTGKRMFEPAWSSDNSRVWFLEDLEHDRRTLRSLSVDATQPVGPAQQIHGCTSVCLLPDSRMAIALLDGIYTVHADSRSGHTFGQPVRRLKADSIFRLSATSDGRKLAYKKGRSESDVFVGDLSDGNTRLSNTHRLTLDDAADLPHAWTWDSRNILFESDRSERWAIYSQPFDSLDPRLLVRNQVNSVKPVVTGGGGTLLYLLIPKGSDLGEHFNGVKIMRMPLAGGVPTEVFAFQHPSNFHCPQVPGKPCVLEERMAGTVQYSYFDPLHGKLGPFRPAEQIPGEIDWDLSPDGSTVAVLPRFGEDDRVWIFKGSEPRREIAVSNVKQLRSLNWWPDGQGFFMASFGDGKPVLMTVPLNGHATVLSKEILSIPSWAVPSPDGKRLAFVGYPNNFKAWMVEDF